MKGCTGLGNAMLGGPEFSLVQLADQLVKVFGADGVALYDKHRGQIARSGPRSGSISDQPLHEMATRGRPSKHEGPWSMAPILHGGDCAGSIGISCEGLSGAMLSAVAGSVGLGLARLYAIEKAAEAEFVRHSEELKSAVQDAMAHEIRNPLNTINIAATALLSDHAFNPVSAQELLTIIKDEVTRIDRLLDESVQIARGKATDISFKKEPQDLVRLIPAAIEEIGPLIGRRSIQVSVPESLPPAECDRAMIVGVLKQLLSNAVKYSPEDSPLTVSAEFVESAVIINVVDRGPGLDDEERDRIFEKHYRGRAARAGIPGTGLGLSSAKSIVEAHGGEIWATSPPAGGAAFHISLPVTMSAMSAGAA